MFYVFQMNDGRWHVDAFTSAPMSARLLAHDIPGSETKAEAEAKRQEASRIWADAKATDAALFPVELTPIGEQYVIPGTERNASPRVKQLNLFGG
jgi:hypothetical protein